MVGKNGTSEKEAIENGAIAKFIEHLAKTRGVTYRQTGREVPINAAGTNYDFELTPDGQSRPKMAVEVFRIFECEGAAEEERRQGYYWSAMQTELEAAGVGPMLVSFPQAAPLRRDAKDLARAHAKVIKDAIDASPGVPKLRVGQFRVVQIPGLKGPALSSSSGGWVDRLGTRPQFARNLAKKNSQLAVVDHERVVLVVNWAHHTEPEDAKHALATIDTSLLTN
ncbi:MAG: hypothetical protein ACYC8T_37580, partial [Myxococcaceae bacterium]